MTLDHERVIGRRFAALANEVDDADWTDVRRRAERASHSRLLLAVGVMLLVIAIAAPALGLPVRVVRIFESSEPAPARVKRDFATLDVGAPKGMATGVIAEQTRKVIDVSIGQGMRGVLWVAPTKAGGFCMTTGFARSHARQVGGGCDRDRVLPFSLGLGVPGPLSPAGEILRGPVLYSGSVLIDEGRAVTFTFEDGAEATAPLVWVSEPIDAGFFVYGVPADHWVEGHHPTMATVEDENGEPLAREQAHWFSGLPRRNR